MSKKELLKYLIAEIDLIMHGKDYRFENTDGTWYSRESCRDLTNEEVFEELKTELRQLADLEAKLAESNESHHKNIVELTKMATEKDKQIAELKQQLAEKDKQILELQEQSIRDNQIYNEELSEKEKEIISLECVISEIHNDIKELHEFKVGDDEYDLTDSDARFSLQCDLLNNKQDKISLAVERLEKVKWWCQGNAIQCFYNEAETEIKEKHIVVDRPQENGSPSLIKYIDNQIKQLKEKNV